MKTTISVTIDGQDQYAKRDADTLMKALLGVTLSADAFVASSNIEFDAGEGELSEESAGALVDADKETGADA